MRFHRKSIKIDDLPDFNLFRRRQVIPVIQLLRLAVLLSNQRRATTEPDYLTLKSDGFHMTLVFPLDYLDTNSLVQADLEREQEYWEDVSGWSLILESDS